MAIIDDELQTLDNSSDSELKRLRQDIEDLAIKYNARTEILNYKVDRLELRRAQLNTETASIPASSPPQVREIQKGDTVQILSKTKGLCGYTGSIVKVTDQQVRLKLDHNSEIVTRYKASVKVIN